MCPLRYKNKGSYSSPKRPMRVFPMSHSKTRRKINENRCSGFYCSELQLQTHVFTCGECLSSGGCFHLKVQRKLNADHFCKDYKNLRLWPCPGAIFFLLQTNDKDHRRMRGCPTLQLLIWVDILECYSDRLWHLLTAEMISVNKQATETYIIVV